MRVEVIQNTSEWFDLRAGKITMSQFAKIMANYGKEFGSPAVDYAHRIALEQLTGKTLSEEGFSNYWTQQGHSNEGIAISLYEKLREDDFVTVETDGFYVSNQNSLVGYSPDGIVQFENGGVEVKSVKYNTFKEVKRLDRFQPAYRWQVCGGIWTAELDYIDCLTYCEAYPEGKNLLVHRVERKDIQKELDMIPIRIEEFEEEIERQKDFILS